MDGWMNRPLNTGNASHGEISTVLTCLEYQKKDGKRFLPTIYLFVVVEVCLKVYNYGKDLIYMSHMHREPV